MKFDGIKENILENYFKLFNLVIKDNTKSIEIRHRNIHLSFISVFITAPLMWAYTFLALIKIQNPIAFYVGFICSTVHIFSPFFFRYTSNRLLHVSIVLLSGLIHQSCFTYYSGGFRSDVLIWFGLLPMIAGINAGKRGAFLWFCITVIAASFFLMLELNQVSFPSELDSQGRLISKCLLIYGLILISSALTWTYNLIEEINSSKIEEKNQSIQNLVAILTHDISNDLSNINLRGQFLFKNLTSNNANPKDIDYVKKLNQSAKNITAIIENVRELHAAELGKKSIEFEEVELLPLINEVKDNFKEKLKDKNIELIINVSDPSIKLKTSKTTLAYQIIGNLLSNAIKFSPTDSLIFITIVKLKKRIIIRLEDQGVGIPDDLLSKIFSIDQSTTRMGTNGEKGTGFGLPIVKVYVTKLGGKIYVESKIKKELNEKSGTIFTLEFRTDSFIKLN